MNCVLRYRGEDGARLSVFRMEDGRYRISYQTHRSRGLSDPIEASIEDVMVRIAEEGWQLVERYADAPSPNESAAKRAEEWRSGLAKEMTKEQADAWAFLPKAR